MWMTGPEKFLSKTKDATNHKRKALTCSISMYAPQEMPPITRRRSQGYFECDPDMRASNPGAWDSAQPIPSDES